jgi:hypothetical protein
MISAVHGLGGIGKTTVARWLVWRPEIERRFPDGRIWITLGNEPPEALTVINDCISQLDPAFKARATVEAARAELATLLQDRSILFVVDDVWPGKSADVAKALLVPAACSRFLLTTRFSRLAGDPAIRATEFLLDEMSVHQGKELMARALGHEISLAEEPLAERLCDIVGGHPLALELAAARIREGRSWSTLLTDLGAEIARLEVLEEADDNLIDPSITDGAREKQKSVRASLLLSVRYLSRDGQKLFAWLGTVSEDATITPKMVATLWDTDEETALRCLRSLSGVGIVRADGDVYRVHDLIHDLARELITAPAIAAQEGDIPGLGLTLQDASRQLLARYQAKTRNGLWHTLPHDGYIHDHLVQHFESAKRESELQSLLWEEGVGGYCGWYSARERLRQIPGFIADVNRIWCYADRRAAATATDGDKRRAIALQLHCGLIIASMNSLSDRVPGEVLAGAVRYGLLEFATALSLARQRSDDFSRALALSALADEMLPEARLSVLSEALTAARSIPLGTWNNIEYAGARGTAFAAVASRLPSEAQLNVLHEALADARTLDMGDGRDCMLTAVALRLPPDEGLAVVPEIDGSGFLGQSLLGNLLATIAPRLPPKEGLAVARDIDDADVRGLALAAVAARLPPEVQLSVLGEALNAAFGITNPMLRVEAPAMIVPLLPPEAQPSMLGEALSAAHSTDDPKRSSFPTQAWRQRAKALVTIAPLLPSQAQVSVLGEALAAARNIFDAEERARALAEIAPLLPVEVQRSVLREALEATHCIADDGDELCRVLVSAASRLPPEEGLAVARSIDHAASRATALMEIAPRLPAEVQPGVLGEALNTARGIDHAASRARALAEMAPLLPSEAQPGVLGEALNTARDIDDAASRVTALVEIAPRLPAEAQPSVLGEALASYCRILVTA